VALNVVLQKTREEDLKMRQMLEEQVEKYRLEVEDLKMRLSEELDRVAFLEREHTCHVEVGVASFDNLIQFLNSVLHTYGYKCCFCCLLLVYCQ